MAIDIVERIIAGGKGIITAELPTFKQLDYEYDLSANSNIKKEKGFGLIVGSADESGSTRFQFVTPSQIFQVILTRVFKNQDSETQQRIKINEIYESGHDLLKVFVRSKMGVAPSITGCVDVVNFNSFDDLEFIDKNTVVVLRLNLLVSYRYQT